jgi:adenylylsulfate kinase-like enzyme
MRRAAGVADVLAEQGHVVIVSLIAPSAVERAAVRAAARHAFHEIFVNAPLTTCERRDPKGLYRRARAGGLPQFTGIESAYEVPHAPELELRTDTFAPDDSAAQLAAYIEEHVL